MPCPSCGHNALAGELLHAVHKLALERVFGGGGAVRSAVRHEPRHEVVERRHRARHPLVVKVLQPCGAGVEGKCPVAPEVHLSIACCDRGSSSSSSSARASGREQSQAGTAPAQSAPAAQTAVPAPAVVRHTRTAMPGGPGHGYGHGGGAGMRSGWAVRGSPSQRPTRGPHTQRPTARRSTRRRRVHHAGPRLAAAG